MTVEAFVARGRCDWCGRGIDEVRVGMVHVTHRNERAALCWTRALGPWAAGGCYTAALAEVRATGGRVRIRP